MRLQKQLSRRIGKVKYSKYVVTIPPKKIKELGWEEGTELDVKAKDGKIILKPKS